MKSRKEKKNILYTSIFLITPYTVTPPFYLF